MGCDGGTIPRRDELVKTKKNPEQKDKDSERLYRWRHCAVSQSILRHPIVACELGRLYTKEELISRFLEKTNEPAMSHLKGLKDVKQLILTTNPSFREDIPNGDAYVDSQVSEYICPVTSQEMNGKSNFIFFWSCGCVISEKALKEIKSDRCLVCNSSYSQDDIIPLNPSAEETKILREKMLERRAKAKATKKEKKQSKREAVSVEETEKKKKKLMNGGPSTSKTSSIVNNEVTNILRIEEFDKIRSKGFSIISDPQKSEVFKSIFDTHKSAKGKTTGHWVTCNPQYF